MFYQDAEYRRGVDLFNRGEFWESHEAWEEIWQEDNRDERIFYQGLIQIAAAFHHLGNRNVRGMRKLLGEGAQKLEPFRPFHEGIDLDRFLSDVGQWRDALERAPDLVPSGLEIPKIALHERETGS
jgi:predicted metal-dependent hydrolase